MHHTKPTNKIQVHNNKRLEASINICVYTYSVDYDYHMHDEVFSSPIFASVTKYSHVYIYIYS